MSSQKTHEPDAPIDWPHGHVAVGVAVADARDAVVDRLRLNDVGVEITDHDDDECMMIRLGDYHHYLHSTTARALSDMVARHGENSAIVTVHGVSHDVNKMALRSLSHQLQTRLREWNQFARERGWPGV